MIEPTKSPICDRVMQCARAAMAGAEKNFMEFGMLTHILIAHKPDGGIECIPAAIANADDEQMLLSSIRRLSQESVATILINEAWRAQADVAPGQPVPKAESLPNRKEVVSVTVWTPTRRVQWLSNIYRGPLISTLGDWEIIMDSEVDDFRTRKHFETETV